MIDIINKSKNEKKFISVWTYTDSEGCWGGIVKDYTEDFLILQHYTKYGKPDGLIVEKLQNIESIDFEDDYSRALEYVIKNSNMLDIDIEIKINIKNPETWQKDILEDLILVKFHNVVYKS
jgi:hypothetical protein